jgi:hypothetical protein
MTACYPETTSPLLYDLDAETARRLYRRHGPTADPSSVACLWDDAEEFLDALDAASLAEGSPSWRLFRDLSEGRSVTNVATAARRLLAAECSMFLKGANPSTEKWEPYRRWSASLGGDDAVITFNYDLVPEILASVGGRLEIALPGHERRDALKCPVFKLHGSVNWKRDGEQISEAQPTYALSGDLEEIVIASPGPAKRNETKRLESLWSGAEHQIRTADAIVFVGYRFPPTDSFARRRIVSAIESNDVKMLCLHTVLGPNTGDPATQRLASILERSIRLKGRTQWARGQGDPNTQPGQYYTLDVTPLWAQDFLDLFVPAHVWQAYRFA